MTLASITVRVGGLLVAAGSVMLSAACSRDALVAPPTPSDPGARLSVQAVPDRIQRDGSSQATIVIEALGADRRPARLVVLRADIFVNGAAAELGTLSSRNLVTGDDGKAQLTYTVPPQLAVPSPETVVTIRVTASGGASATLSRNVPVHALAKPTTDFSYSPATDTSIKFHYES